MISLKEEQVVIHEDVTPLIVTTGMKFILDAVYRGKHCPEASLGVKIPMIKTLRIMGEMKDGSPWGLKACKEYIEKNWDFEEHK